MTLHEKKFASDNVVNDSPTRKIVVMDEGEGEMSVRVFEWVEECQVETLKTNESGTPKTRQFIARETMPFAGGGLIPRANSPLRSERYLGAPTAAYQIIECLSSIIPILGRRLRTFRDSLQPAPAQPHLSDLKEKSQSALSDAPTTIASAHGNNRTNDLVPEGRHRLKVTDYYGPQAQRIYSDHCRLRRQQHV